MTAPVHVLTDRPALGARAIVATASRIALMVLVAASASACRDPFESGAKVDGWSVTDPAQRHPILVSEQPSTMTLHVGRGSYGLAPGQRAELISFLSRFRSHGSGSSKIVISAPGGSANEVAAMQTVAEIRALMMDEGYDASSVHVEAYTANGGNPPVRVSYMRYVAEGPECGHWNTNVADEPKNLSMPNFGCATQRNFAAMVANPADLLGPRNMTPRTSERRTVVWDKFNKGESTVSDKKESEQVKLDQ